MKKELFLMFFKHKRYKSKVFFICIMSSNLYSTQNDLLLNTLMTFYTEERIEQMLKIINGDTKISLRIIDWFATNYAKKKVKQNEYLCFR